MPGRHFKSPIWHFGKFVAITKSLKKILQTLSNELNQWTLNLQNSLPPTGIPLYKIISTKNALIMINILNLNLFFN